LRILTVVLVENKNNPDSRPLSFLNVGDAFARWQSVSPCPIPVKIVKVFIRSRQVVTMRQAIDGTEAAGKQAGHHQQTKPKEATTGNGVGPQHQHRHEPPASASAQANVIHKINNAEAVEADGQALLPAAEG
jgi:hypothetical protein